MDDFVTTVLLAVVSVLLSINLFVLKGIREDFKKLWEKIDLLFTKHDATMERLIKAEAEIDNCLKQWDRRQ